MDGYREKIFRRGIEEGFPTDQDYFRSGLAVTLLRKADYSMVEQELNTIKSVRLQPNVTLLRIHLNGLTHSQTVPDLLEQLNVLSKTHCSQYTTELVRHFRECLSMNDEILFDAAVSCLALAA